MFEIWGTLNGRYTEKDKRLSEHFTRVLNHEEEKSILFVPPSLPLWQKKLEQEQTAVLTFKYFRYENSPYVTAQQLKSALQDFLPFREKMLVSLSPICTDYNLKSGTAIPLTINIAQFKAAVNCSCIYFDEGIGSSYFTYKSENTHLVWVEDTKAIAYKHNLIKAAGFKGIYWENPYALLEGGWESLTAIYKKA